MDGMGGSGSRRTQTREFLNIRRNWACTMRIAASTTWLCRGATTSICTRYVHIQLLPWPLGLCIVPVRVASCGFMSLALDEQNDRPFFDFEAMERHLLWDEPPARFLQTSIL